MPKRKQSDMPVADPVNQADTVPVKKRGRPVGSKNKIKTSRPDSTVQAEPGDNTKFILHDMKLFNLPEIDVNNPASVSERINRYFAICSEDDIKPSIESLALSFGVNRITLFNWITGKSNRIQTPECLNTLKRAYDFINSYYAHMMNNGKINPVAGIFLMKNNMGYKDTTDYVITPNTEQRFTLSDIANRAGLLDE